MHCKEDNENEQTLNEEDCKVVFDIENIIAADRGSSEEKHIQDKLRSIQKKKKSVIVVTLLLLTVALLVSFCTGRYTMSPSEVLASIGNGVNHLLWQIRTWFGNMSIEPEWLVSSQDKVVWLVRMPRIYAAVLVGSALSLSGAVYQGLFRNPMVSPDILGASAGASVGACLMMLFYQNDVIIQIGAFAMGVAAVILSYSLSAAIGKKGNSVLMLVLCGMTVNALFQAFVSIIKYLADPESQLPEMTYWLMGSIAKVDYDNLRVFILIFLIGVVPLLLLRWRLNTLSFGEDEAKAMGVNVGGIRVICIVCATLLTASVVAFAGTIGWVGLMIPHLVRFLVGPDNKMLLPMSMLVGALFMLVIDNLCRTIFPYEIPLGVLTSLLGAPFFLYILYRRKGES